MKRENENEKNYEIQVKGFEDLVLYHKRVKDLYLTSLSIKNNIFNEK